MSTNSVLVNDGTASSPYTNLVTINNLQPYIRAQKLILSAKGMKINTPVSVYFDGVNVDDYIIQPNFVVLTNVQGTFNQGDVVGYMSGSLFVPTARVVGSSNNYSGIVKLALASDITTSNVYSTSSILQNAFFNQDGTYVNSTANGTYFNAPNTQIVLSGTIASSSGGTTTTLDSGIIYRTGANTITLSSLASPTDNYYVGSVITVTAYNEQQSVEEYWYNPGGSGDPEVRTRTIYIPKQEIKSSNIIAYNGNTKVATLSSSTPVNVSSGTSKYNGTNLTSTYTIKGTQYLISEALKSSTVPTLSTDVLGNFTAIFDLPSNMFKTGDKVVRIDNRTTVTDPNSATTFAQGIFLAASLVNINQTVSNSPTVQSSAQSTVLVSQEKKQQLLINDYVSTIDPLAQTFQIDRSSYPNGAFISSVKLFFRNKPNNSYTTPIKLFLTDTLNGTPQGIALDNSVVAKTSTEVAISDTPHYLDSTSYTEFVFPAPVYIKPNNLYAFILQSSSSDYNLWIASENGVALPSTVKALPTDTNPTEVTKITSSPYVGSLFESQNGSTWSSNKSKNLMFVIDNCVFDTTAMPEIDFVVPKKLPLRKDVGFSDIQYFNNANTVPNISGVYYGKDLLMSGINLSTTDFTPTSTSISYTYTPYLSSTYSGDVTKSVSPGKFGTTMVDNIYFDDGLGSRVLDSNSSSSFTLAATLSTQDKYVTPVISDDGVSLFAIQSYINNMSISNNTITVTSGNTFGVTANYSSTPPLVTISAPTGSGGSQAYATANLVYNPATTGYYVDKINVITEGSGYVETPTITIAANTGGKSATAIVAGETSARGGNGLSRYITKKVTLTPENDSADLRVYYTAYKPVGTRINVYYKILNRNDINLFEDQNWVLMTDVGLYPNSYSLSRDNLIEYIAAPGINNKANNQITYTNSSGTTFTNFSQFAIKIVLSTTDTGRTPVLHDLRVLALPSYSGI